MDMREYLAGHDLVYESPPKIWQDALVCGNGDLGTMFFAPFFPEFLINKADIWDCGTGRGKLIKHKDVLAAIAKGKSAKDAAAAGKSRTWKPSAPKTGGKIRLRFGKDDNWAGAHQMACRLSLFDGVLHTAMDRHLSHPRLESFVHSGRNVFCLRARDVSALQDKSIKVELMRPVDHAYALPAFGRKDDTIWMRMDLPRNFSYVIAVRSVLPGRAAYLDYERKHYRTQHRIRLAERAAASIEPDRASLQLNGDFELFVSVVTSNESKNPLKAALALVGSAAAAGYGKSYQEHVKWWKRFWSRSSITLHDKVLEQLWYTSVYVQASQYRKAPVPGLQGLWFGPSIASSQTLQWRGDYTNDQNTEIVPMPFFSSNHLELIEPFYDTFNRMIPQLKKDTREIYGVRGLDLPLSLGPDGKRGTYGQYSQIHCGGPYHGLIYSWGWRYFRDKKMLREKIYPFLREVCNFFADYMTWDEAAGRYRLYPSQPAEIPILDVGNPTHTLSLLKVTLKTAIEASEILGTNAADRKRWIHLIEHYPEYPVGDGIYLEGDTIPARHYISQPGGLYPVFPCGEFDETSAAEILRRAKKTFRKVMARQAPASYAQTRGHNLNNGWEVFFHTMQAMRLGLKGEARNLLYREFLRMFMKPNGLFSHNAIILADPKESEANLDNIPDAALLDGDEEMPLRELLSVGFGNCTANLEAKEQVFSAIEDSSMLLMIVNEMLMQSHNGILRLFPACPPDWEEAGFRDFRAEGAFLVSSSLHRGKVAFVTIKGLAGGGIRVKNPWPDKRITIQRGRPERRTFSKFIELQLKKNETVSLYARKADFARAQNTVPKNTNTPGPKRLRFYDGSRAWLGKPELSEYYKW